MKCLFLSLVALATIIGCGKDDDSDSECTIVGRWEIEGLNGSTLYEFTSGLRYSIYTSSPGVFGTLEDAIPNPNEYSIEGDSLIIDLNFGNISKTRPVFKCDCNVLELVNTDGTGVLFKEGYNYDDCDE